MLNVTLNYDTPLTGAHAVMLIVDVAVAAQIVVIVAIELSLQVSSADSEVASSFSVWNRASSRQRYAIRCCARKCRVLRKSSEDSADDEHVLE